jgi:hypothetical protein
MLKDWAIIEQIVQKIIKRSKYKHVFLHFTVEDIEQEIRQIALIAYQQYNSSRGPLENFLARAIKNRIHNLKRDNGLISQFPCISYKCAFYDKKLKKCKWDNNKCLDWQNYIRLSTKRHAVLHASYHNDDKISSNQGISVEQHLSEMLELAEKRKMMCRNALFNFIHNGTEIPKEFHNDIETLVKEVAGANN